MKDAPLVARARVLLPMGLALVWGCSSSLSRAAADASTDSTVPGEDADATTDGPTATCGPLTVLPFDAGPPAMGLAEAGAPCTRDIDCANGDCVVVFETCATPSMLEGPGKGGSARDGGACVSPPAFPSACDSAALTWSQPVDISKNMGSLAESDTTVVEDGHGTVLVAWANNTTAKPMLGGRQFNGLALSTDEGQTFAQVPAPVNLATDSENDAELAVDANGLFYFAWESYADNFAGAQHVFASTSMDGKTWSKALQIDAAGDDGDGATPLDFPFLAINPVGRKPYYTYQITTSTGPVPLRLVVGGAGGGPVGKSVELDDGTRPNSYRDLASGAFDAKGSFYATWFEASGSFGSSEEGLESGDTGNAVYFTRVDLDAQGSTAPLGHDVLVTAKGEEVLFGLPRIQVTPDASTVYVKYEVGVKNAIDVRVTTSHDRGATWGPAVKVNDDPTCATHFRATTFLDAEGRLWVLWYDNRDGAGHVVYSVSDDGGQSFHANHLVTPYPFPFEDFQYSTGWLGDYFQVASGGGSLLAAWADPREDDRSHVSFSKATLPP